MDDLVQFLTIMCTLPLLFALSSEYHRPVYRSSVRTIAKNITESSPLQD